MGRAAGALTRGQLSARWLGLRLAAAGLLLLSLSGCSLFVMAGKMVFGDPQMDCAFTAMSGVDLVKEQKRVAVLCSAPEFVRGEAPSLDVELVECVTAHLRRNDVKVLKQDDIAGWIDDRGGLWGEPSELALKVAQAFKLDYVIHIDVEQFSFQEEHSADLLRGSTIATVTAFAVTPDSQGPALQVFVREFRSSYPKHYPVSKESMSEKTFQKRYLDRVGLALAQLFYNHRMSEEIE